ncbi:MAG: folylpolyglutamate synthase/dihydrofolate synthase family protein [Verrucomicrobiota bacterium]
MPASLADSLQRLYARTAHGIKLGLEVETNLLQRMGNPHLRMPHVHVAGTNGKGSVCAMLESVLRSAGYRTGLYTSPHLVRFNERIRVAGQCISDEELGGLFDEVEQLDRELAAAPGGRQATFFEFTTALAFEHFRRQKAELAVLETGLGGRLDATNVVMPLVSVITRIDIEHTQYLGKTLTEIAAEKAGIIKPGRTVICGSMPDEARDVIKRTAADRRATLILVEDAVSVRRVSQDLHGQKVKIDTPAQSYGTVVLPLPGKYQMENVALAVAAAQYVNDASPFVVRDDAVKKGLKSVRWPARCQVLSEDPLVILDVAHNPNGARALAESLRELAKGKELGLIVGLLSDKDCRGFMTPFASLVKKCWAVQIQNERTMPMDQLLACTRSVGLEAAGSPLSQALAEAKEWGRGANRAVCIAGSLFLAGEVLQAEGLGDKLYS